MLIKYAGCNVRILGLIIFIHALVPIVIKMC